MFQCLGNIFLSINATHNTTQYKGIMLYMIIVQDNWGHGMSIWSPNRAPKALMSPGYRCSSCLDVLIIPEERGCHVLPYLGKGSESRHSAICHYVCHEPMSSFVTIQSRSEVATWRIGISESRPSKWYSWVTWLCHNMWSSHDHMIKLKSHNSVTSRWPCHNHMSSVTSMWSLDHRSLIWISNTTLWVIKSGVMSSLFSYWMI